MNIENRGLNAVAGRSRFPLVVKFLDRLSILMTVPGLAEWQIAEDPDQTILCTCL